MKILITFLLFTLILAANACADVASNNQAANGGQQKTSDEKSSTKENPNEDSATPDLAANSTDSDTNDDKILLPEKLVENLYDRHDNESSPFFQNRDRKIVDRYFAKSFADLIWKDANESEEEAAALDFDPLYNAQDTEISDFKIGTAEINGEKAIVPVTFKNFGEEQILKYKLAKENSIWKIENIDYGENDLMQTLKGNSN